MEGHPSGTSSTGPTAATSSTTTTITAPLLASLNTLRSVYAGLEHAENPETMGWGELNNAWGGGSGESDAMLTGLGTSPRDLMIVEQTAATTKPTRTTTPRQKPSNKRGSPSAGASSSSSSERFKWSDALHLLFLSSIFDIGLQDASPQKVYKQMVSDPATAQSLLGNDPNLAERIISGGGEGWADGYFGPHHVKSHLQRFRANVKDLRTEFLEHAAKQMEIEKAARKATPESKRSRVLNPEFHAYPLSMRSATTTTGESFVGEGDVSRSSDERPFLQQQHGPLLTSAPSSSSSSFLETDAGVAQMRAQMRMREHIEFQGSRQTGPQQVVEPIPDASLISPKIVASDLGDDLFDWLIMPDIAFDSATATATASSISSSASNNNAFVAAKKQL